MKGEVTGIEEGKLEHTPLTAPVIESINPDEGGLFPGGHIFNTYSLNWESSNW